MAKRRIPEVLTPEEQERFLKTFNQKAPTGLRNYAMVRLMLDAGLRCGEVLNLKTNDVDFQTGKIHVKQGKGEKDRIVWLNEEALEVLRKWREIKPESEYLFTTLQGNPINPRYVRDMVKRKGKQAGITKDVHPHMLRHSFATDLYRESKNLRLVQKALGHSSISTTEIYTHIIDEELEREMKFFRSKEVA
ncbi:MAG: tyrosine-type recombinase/integrase [Atribacterota bacterium]|jgi:site-specific recombinase XerD|nr:tyrosine-type recombinase/integrase [Atribacterota bacterium]